MAIELRDYQKKTIAETYQAIREGKRRIVLQVPTGGGKTSIFAQIVADFVSKRSQRVVCVAHRTELIAQMSDRLALFGVANWAQRQGGNQYPEMQVHCVSVQTFQGKRYQRPENVGLVIIDENHHVQSGNSYNLLFEQYPSAIFIGVTATPVRLDGKGFEDVFEHMVNGPTYQYLRDSGYLSGFRAFAGMSPDLRTVKTQAGDYKIRQLAEACDETVLIGNLVETYQRYAGGKSCIVFAASVEHSLHIVQRYRDAGYAADHIDGTTPPEVRKAILDSFKVGKTKILSNFAIVTEGFDVPGAEVVQLARPTKSLSLYLQMVGRVLRVSDGKENAIILDHGGLIEEHGLPSDEHSWSLQGCQKKKTRTLIDDRGEILADKSEPLLAPGEKKTKVVIEKNGKMVEVTAESVAEGDVLKLIAKQQANGYKPGWCLNRLIANKGSSLTLDHFRLLGKHLGYHSKWARKRWSEFQEELADQDPPNSNHIRPSLPDLYDSFYEFFMVNEHGKLAKLSIQCMENDKSWTQKKLDQFLLAKTENFSAESLAVFFEEDR